MIFAQVVTEAGPVREIENDFNELLTKHGRRAVERALARQLPRTRRAMRQRPAQGSLGLAG